VFDETLRRSFEYMVASWWMIGVVLQIGAGLIGRIRLGGQESPVPGEITYKP